MAISKNENLGPVGQVIVHKLTNAFSPDELTVRDESSLHEGHAGARPEGETHFRVHIVSERFKDATRVACHRMVNATLKEELAERVHALAISARAPGD